MNRILRVIGFVFLVGTAVPVVAQHPHGGSMPVGYHEFRFFGGNGDFYLSHFPMFSSIHAFQYIVKVELDEKANEAMVKESKEDPKQTRQYQLSPFRKNANSPNPKDDQEDWVLPDKLQPGNTFTGAIFYREKKKIVPVSQNTTVKVVSIVWKQELNPSFPRPQELTYILFGTPQAAFLAHQLSAPPKPGKEETDFDQILSVKLPSSVKQMPPLNSEAQRFAVAGSKNVEKAALEPKQTVTLTQLVRNGEKIEVEVLSQIQREQLSTQR